MMSWDQLIPAALIKANFRLLLFFRGVVGLTLSHSFKLGITFTSRRFLHLAFAAVISIYRSEMSFSSSLSISCGRTPAKSPIAKYLANSGSRLWARFRSSFAALTDKIDGGSELSLIGLRIAPQGFLSIYPSLTSQLKKGPILAMTPLIVERF